MPIVTFLDKTEARNPFIYPDVVGENIPMPVFERHINCYSILNYLVVTTCEEPIFWKNQIGFNCTMHHKESNVFVPGQFYEYQPEHVFIRIHVEIGPMATIDTDEILKELKVWYPHYGVEIIGTLLRNTETVMGRYDPSTATYRRTFHINLSIPADDIRKNNGVVYVPHVGLVIGFAQFKEQAKHPLSAMWYRDELNKAIEKGPGSQLRIVAVDNSGNNNKFWYNTGMRVNERPVIIPVVSLYNPSLKSGFYLTFLNNFEHYQTEHLDFDEGFEVLGIYRSKDEAQHFGSPKGRNAEELLRIEAENNRVKLEINTQKIELEKIQLENARLKTAEEAKERAYEIERLQYEKALKEKDDILKLKEMEYRQLELETKAKIAGSKKVTDILKTVGDIFKALLGLSAVVTFVVSVYNYFTSPKTAG